MPIGTITNSEAGSSVRTKLNAVISATNSAPTDYDPAGSAAAVSASLGNSAGLDVGTTAGTVAAGNDGRFTDSRAPTGSAGGVLSGTYPNPGYATGAQAFLDADRAKLDAIAGTNTGDNAVNSLYSSLVSNATHSGEVTGATVLTIANDAVTNAKAANMAASTIKARKTASTGDPEDCTLSDVLDFIGSAAQGDILYRGASAWARLAAGTSGQFLKTLGAGANPAWASHELRIPIFFSDQTTDWSTGTKVTFTWRFGTTTLSSTPFDCVTAPTGSVAQFDVKKNGTSMYSTKPTIDAGETTTDTAVTPAVLSTTSLANGDIVTIIIDQFGSTIKGQGGVITFVGTTIP